jgi:hypothetical protein
LQEAVTSGKITRFRTETLRHHNSYIRIINIEKGQFGGIEIRGPEGKGVESKVSLYESIIF